MDLVTALEHFLVDSLNDPDATTKPVAWMFILLTFTRMWGKMQGVVGRILDLVAKALEDGVQIHVVVDNAEELRGPAVVLGWPEDGSQGAEKDKPDA